MPPIGDDALLYRELGGEIRVRADAAGESRIIEGVVIPYGEIATVRDSPTGPRYRETIAPGAAAGLEPGRVLLESLTRAPSGAYNTHAGAALVGRGVAAEEGDRGLTMAFRVARTRDGDELLELAREGVLPGLSAGFRPVTNRTRPDGVVEHTQIELRRVAVVGSGAYPGATVTAVRAASEGDMPASNQAAAAAAEGEQTDEQGAAAETPATQAPAGDRPNRTRVTVDVERAAAEQRERAAAERETVDELARSGPVGRVPGYVTRAEAIYGPGRPYGFLSDGLAARSGDAEAADRQRRYQAHAADVATSLERVMSWGDDGMLQRAGDVLSSEIPGAYPNDYLPGLLTPRILKGRPMGGFYQRFPIADARPRVFPKATTATVAAVQSAEGAALSATDFATTAVTVTPLMYGAYTDVSRQAIDGADPAAQSMVISDLLEAYSQVSEGVIKTAVEAGSTDSGIAIAAATPYAGALANVVNYYGTRFTPATASFIPPAAFSTLLAQADTTGRPLVPQLGAVNSDGVVNVGGAITAPLLSSLGTLSWQSTANTWVFGVPSDFVIFESSIAQFSYDQVVGPQAVRIGIWAYLVVGTRLGSLKRLAV